MADGRPAVLHLIDSFGIGGAQQRYFNDLRHLSGDFDHRPWAVFGDCRAPQAASLERRLRSLELKKLRDLPLGLWRLIAVLRADPSIRIIHTQLFASDTLGRLAGLICRRPVVSTIQASIYEPESGLYSGWRHRTDTITSKRAASIIAVSEFVRQSVNRRLGVPLENILVIPNTVDLQLMRPDGLRRERTRAGLGMASGDFVWLTVGRLHPSKGYVGLLKAFSTVVQFHPRVRLLIAGGGPQLHELEALANALNVSSRVHFLGDRDDVTALFDASDAFVFPSLSEGLPVSLLEAMAMNKPVVASRIGPHEEVVEDNVSGLLVTTGDSHALASAMMRLQSEHLLRERLVAAAKTRVVHFDAIGGATALTALYTRILDHARG